MNILIRDFTNIFAKNVVLDSKVRSIMQKLNHNIFLLKTPNFYHVKLLITYRIDPCPNLELMKRLLFAGMPQIRSQCGSGSSSGMSVIFHRNGSIFSMSIKKEIWIFEFFRHKIFSGTQNQVPPLNYSERFYSGAITMFYAFAVSCSLAFFQLHSHSFSLSVSLCLSQRFLSDDFPSFF
jgi:hypothetical protein